jgi:hypothetical protein
LRFFFFVLALTLDVSVNGFANGIETPMSLKVTAQRGSRSGAGSIGPNKESAAAIIGRPGG